MNDESNRIYLSRLLHAARLAVMAGGYLMLLVEIRFQHRAALIDDWRPWMPIVFCNSMIYLIPIAGVFWRRGGRQTLIAVYTLTIMLGLIGVYFHSEGHLLDRLMEVMRVWIIPPAQGAELAAHYPPVLAPLAFVGLGTIGLLFCFDAAPAKSEARISVAEIVEEKLGVES